MWPYTNHNSQGSNLPIRNHLAGAAHNPERPKDSATPNETTWLDLLHFAGELTQMIAHGIMISGIPSTVHDLCRHLAAIGRDNSPVCSNHAHPNQNVSRSSPSRSDITCITIPTNLKTQTSQTAMGSSLKTFVVFKAMATNALPLHSTKELSPCCTRHRRDGPGITALN